MLSLQWSLKRLIFSCLPLSVPMSVPMSVCLCVLILAAVYVCVFSCLSLRMSLGVFLPSLSSFVFFFVSFCLPLRLTPLTSVQMLPL